MKITIQPPNKNRPPMLFAAKDLRPGQLVYLALEGETPTINTIRIVTLFGMFRPDNGELSALSRTGESEPRYALVPTGTKIVLEAE